MPQTQLIVPARSSLGLAGPDENLLSQFNIVKVTPVEGLAAVPKDANGASHANYVVTVHRTIDGLTVMSEQFLTFGCWTNSGYTHYLLIAMIRLVEVKSDIERATMPLNTTDVERALVAAAIIALRSALAPTP